MNYVELAKYHSPTGLSQCNINTGSFFENLPLNINSIANESYSNKTAFKLLLSIYTKLLRMSILALWG